MSWLPNWLTGLDEENAKRAAVADDKLRAMNQAKIDAGIYSPAQAAQIAKDYNSQEVFGVENQTAAIDQTFWEALPDNRDAIKSFVNGAVWQSLKSIPFVVWIAAAVAVFVWMGGLSLLKGKFAK